MNKLIIFLLISITLYGSSYGQDTIRAEDKSTVEDTIRKDRPQGGVNKIQNKHGRRFVDENGDGYNDYAPDHDGDGIPNGLDPDYNGSKNRRRHRGFIDANSDGINDNAGGRGNRGRNSRYGRHSQTIGKDGDTTGIMDRPAQPNRSGKDSLRGTGEDSLKVVK